MLSEQLLDDSRADKEEREASQQVYMEMSVAEEPIIDELVDPIETIIGDVTVSDVLQSRAITTITAARQGAKRKANTQRDDDEGEETVAPPLKKARPTAGQKAEREASLADADNHTQEAAMPLARQAAGGRPRRTAATTEPPAEPRNLRSRSSTTFLAGSLPVAATAKRTTKRKATPVAEDDCAPEQKKPKGRLRNVAPAAEEERALAPKLKKTKGQPRKAAAVAPTATSAEPDDRVPSSLEATPVAWAAVLPPPLPALHEGRVLRSRSVTALATAAAVPPPPPSQQEGRILTSRSATPFVPLPPHPPAQPKPKRAARKMSSEAEQQAGAEDKEAPPQRSNGANVVKAAKPSTRRSTRRKKG
jgi:hypothetical protein